MADAPQNAWKRISLITIPAIIIIGDVIGVLSQSGFRNAWFAGLNLPPFTPPGWAFGVAWNILYALMGIALAMILALRPSPRRQAALTFFFCQLVLNFAWSPIFFAGHDIRLAKVIIFAMAVLAAIAARQFLTLRRAAGMLMLPYLAWLIFAATLNFTIEDLNPGAGTSLLARHAR